jgi:23S rRNA-/tRNA-specific pseudouridylate synthase
LHNTVQILKESNGLIALSKPVGILSHPNTKTDFPRSLFQCQYSTVDDSFYWLGEKIWLLHRLDSCTSGVILIATEEKVAAAVKRAFAHRTVLKTYEALVFGRPSFPKVAASWSDDMKYYEGVQRIASTDLKSIKVTTSFPMRSRLELRPHTGFTHQLRIQCSKRGLPIIGDKTHGNFDLNGAFNKLYPNLQERLFLHSRYVNVAYTLDGKLINFEAEDCVSEAFTTAMSSISVDKLR